MAWQLVWSVDSAGWQQSIRTRLDALMQRMTAEANAYWDYALSSRNKALISDAQRLRDWIDTEAKPVMRGTVQDALDAAPFAETVIVRLMAAVESPLDRIKARDSDEGERWSDVVDWLYQMPGSLRDLMDLEGLQWPAEAVMEFIQLTFQQDQLQPFANLATVSFSGIPGDQQLEGLVA